MIGAGWDIGEGRGLRWKNVGVGEVPLQLSPGVYDYPGDPC